MVMLHHHKMSRKGRTELIIGASGAKEREEADGGVQKFTAPQNHDKNPSQEISETKKSEKKMFGRQKMKCRGLSETVFAEV